MDFKIFRFKIHSDLNSCDFLFLILFLIFFNLVEIDKLFLKNFIYWRGNFKCEIIFYYYYFNSHVSILYANMHSVCHVGYFPLVRRPYFLPFSCQPNTKTQTQTQTQTDLQQEHKHKPRSRSFLSTEHKKKNIYIYIYPKISKNTNTNTNANPSIHL